MYDPTVPFHPPLLTGSHTSDHSGFFQHTSGHPQFIHFRHTVLLYRYPIGQISGTPQSCFISPALFPTSQMPFPYPSTILPAMRLQPSIGSPVSLPFLFLSTMPPKPLPLHHTGRAIARPEKGPLQASFARPRQGPATPPPTVPPVGGTIPCLRIPCRPLAAPCRASDRRHRSRRPAIAGRPAGAADRRHHSRRPSAARNRAVHRRHHSSRHHSAGAIAPACRHAADRQPLHAAAGVPAAAGSARRSSARPAPHDIRRNPAGQRAARRLPGGSKPPPLPTPNGAVKAARYQAGLNLP